MKPYIIPELKLTNLNVYLKTVPCYGSIYLNIVTLYRYNELYRWEVPYNWNSSPSQKHLKLKVFMIAWGRNSQFLYICCGKNKALLCLNILLHGGSFCTVTGWHSSFSSMLILYKSSKYVAFLFRWIQILTI